MPKLPYLIPWACSDCPLRASRDCWIADAIPGIFTWAGHSSAMRSARVTALKGH